MADNRIYFTRFTIVPGKVSFRCRRVMDGKEIVNHYYFKFNIPALPSDTTVALVLIDLMKDLNVFQDIFIDLYVPNVALTAIRDLYRNRNPGEATTITCRSKPRAQTRLFARPPKQREHASQNPYALLFSGGIDSLAAHYLFENIPLISIEWGDKYQREKTMFENFDPFIIRTNIRNFAPILHMPSIAMLLKDFLGFSHIITGDVFEASPHEEQRFASTETQTCGIEETGVVEEHPIYFANEIITLMVVTHYCIDQVPLSLASCANEKTEKRFRKDLIAKTIYQNWGLSPNFEVSAPPDRPSLYGYCFARDYLSLYFAKMLGKDLVTTYIKIPESVVDHIEQSDFSFAFFEKYDQRFLYCIPQNLRDSVIIRLRGAGIYSFDAHDWDEYREIVKILETRWSISSP